MLQYGPSGSDGSGNGQFNSPWRSVEVSGDVYVTDSATRIQVFGPSADPREVHEWGRIKALYR